MLLEYLEANGWNQRGLARRTGLTPKTISEVCSGKGPITPATALALEKVFQRPAHLWLNLQRQFDEAVARTRSRETASAWREWSAGFPLKKMREYGWLFAEGDDDVDALLSFFAVSSPDSWMAVWENVDVAYRQTRKIQLRQQATIAWLRAAELVASEIQTAPFDEARFRAAVIELRSCTRMKADKIMKPVQETCAAAGVAIVWVRELPHTGISGCARWLSSRRALIALTLRYKTDDQLWFTLFHEAGHILLHRKERPFVLDNVADEPEDEAVDPQMRRFEDEADRFAADTLIPPESLDVFLKTARFDNEDIYDFADKVGVGPGIVVGRLQNEGVLKRFQGNQLKQKLAWGVPEKGTPESGGA
jgi:addiction module HigA family antidote